MPDLAESRGTASPRPSSDGGGPGGGDDGGAGGSHYEPDEATGGSQGDVSSMYGRYPSSDWHSLQLARAAQSPIELRADGFPFAS